MSRRPGHRHNKECWIAARDGEVPPGAFIGGEDNGEPMYVIRAYYEGSLLPGKLLESQEQGYVPWAGSDNAVFEYEVLCDFHGSWHPCSGDNIPPNAVPAGTSGDGEILYVGRVVHDGTLTVGKVQPSLGFLYIPFYGEELSFSIFEILCY
ncbi:uncharacterized protein LOC132698016 isoform X2 [Cylas formicarius]|uniref:uncharacterized protein LOC132698016 isoform X2 n=1 Tax=Cylas formicarius TaxID=197179 RepID=UPI002958BBCB|nr:uncharacterized protein LOC132698016 isoform X2 [Cylas formicarius]